MEKNDEYIDCFLYHAYKPEFYNMYPDNDYCSINAESLSCSDQITLHISKSDTFKVTFTGNCCRVCLACTSLVVSTINKSSEDEIDKIDLNFIKDKFGAVIVDSKTECCSLVLKALNTYKKRKGEI